MSRYPDDVVRRAIGSRICWGTRWRSRIRRTRATAGAAVGAEALGCESSAGGAAVAKRRERRIATSAGTDATVRRRLLISLPAWRDSARRSSSCTSSQRCARKLGKVVATSGGFDPIHPGHISCIIESAGFGDVLVVIVNGDTFLTEKKGKPFQDCRTRCLIVSGLRDVDYVVPFDAPGDPDRVACTRRDPSRRLHEGRRSGRREHDSRVGRVPRHRRGDHHRRRSLEGVVE